MSAHFDVSLRGRHTLVTGGSAGIGRAAALALAALGARVTVLARSRDRLEALLPELRAAGAEDPGAVIADHDDRPGLRAAIDALLAEAGPVHVLVNNTGGPPSGPMLEASEAQLIAAFSRNVLAFHESVKAVLPGMTGAGYGRIVNVLSVSVREPIVGLGVGNVVRAAVAAWAKTLSKELPPAVTINNVLPGYTATARLGELARAIASRTGQREADIEAGWVAGIPEGRLGDPSELGATIAFLCSPAGGFIRGQSLAVDGGRLNGI